MSTHAADPALLEQIRARLEAEFAPERLTIKDDSARHAGHLEAAGGCHLKLNIVSGRFSGLSRLKRHQLIYATLSAELAGPVHALNIAASSPGEPGSAG